MSNSDYVEPAVEPYVEPYIEPYVEPNPVPESYLSAERLDPAYRRNRWTFGLGTIGRDMVYTLISMFLIIYLTQIGISNRDLGIITGIIVAF